MSGRPALAAVTRGSFSSSRVRRAVHSQLYGEMNLTLFRDFRQAGLAGGGKVRHLFFLRRGDSETARLAGGHVWAAGFQRRWRIGPGIRHFNAGQSRAPSQRCQGFYQLAIVAPRPDRATKAFEHRRKPRRLAAHRYSQRRCAAAETGGSTASSMSTREDPRCSR